jgi:hypothetical protein
MHLVNGVYHPDSTLLITEDVENNFSLILTATPPVHKRMIKKEVGSVSRLNAE